MAVEPVAELDLGGVDDLVARSRKEGDGADRRRRAVEARAAAVAAQPGGAWRSAGCSSSSSCCASRRRSTPSTSPTPTPYENHLTEQVVVDGTPKDVVSPDGVPIGPTWHAEFFLGADESGRDIAVRLLYGGRTSLIIGCSARRC